MQYWTYPEEDVSDEKCWICKGKHNELPCYFEYRLYKNTMRDSLLGNFT
jgi:hypothetical protein